MEKYCECNYHEKGFNDAIASFLKSYNKFLKRKGKNITSKKIFQELIDEYNLLITLTKYIKPKGEDTIVKLAECYNNHHEQIEEIQSKMNKTDELIESINRNFKRIKKEIPKSLEEEEEQNDNINNIINDKPKEEMSVREIMENDKKNIILIQNLLEDEEIKRKYKNDIKEIIKIKNELKEIVGNIEAELNRNDDQINNIEDKVNNSVDLVNKGDENLKEAAKDAIKRRRLKYQIGLGTALCAAGSFVPGIGNAIGAALGGLIGYGIYRIDKHRLNKILEKEKKEKEKKK